MFEWFEEEICEINTNRFHVVDGPASDELRMAIEGSGVSLPRSYKDFVLRFGNADLYRELSYHVIGVFAAPREVVSKVNGEPLLLFGHYDSSSAYFKESLLRGNGESPVFEGDKGSLRQIADGFEAWLKKRCAAARRRYSKKDWAAIVAGPAPFTADEQRIVEARRQFSWRVVGFGPEGDVRFEVHNGSDLVLPYLSVGIRSKAGKLEGGAWLPVSHIRPQHTAIVEKDCYRDLIPRDDVEAYPLPDPEPEDRDRYWEFRPLPS